ncbi:GNAT family N-acetyltransferase [Haoranjiania flava]|uniref:GNAT family N-acetyltransferase n=1 Tax=Haoranjiania flava TaxID=1856322 RepID=A0AAE3IN93_9BACT|nr:GNAT family N-acetyltransferase [Haoranjiania flava]MCU7693436.1 GNAT family N-acetyltransferase [Haoranjiania flava]
MQENFIIRDYTPEDKPALLEILQLNVPAYFAESEISDFEQYADNGVEKYFIIEYNNKIIGSGGINFNHRTGIISWDFIHPAFHGKGAGTQLLQYRINLLKQLKNIEAVTVRTSQFSYQFYEKNGFVLHEIIKDYWAKGYDMYKMFYEL